MELTQRWFCGRELPYCFGVVFAIAGKAILATSHLVPSFLLEQQNPNIFTLRLLIDEASFLLAIN